MAMTALQEKLDAAQSRLREVQSLGLQRATHHIEGPKSAGQSNKQPRSAPLKGPDCRAESTWCLFFVCSVFSCVCVLVFWHRWSSCEVFACFWTSKMVTEGLIGHAPGTAASGKTYCNLQHSFIADESLLRQTRLVPEVSLVKSFSAWPAGTFSLAMVCDDKPVNMG